VLWADAICIDQTNLDERGEQVQIMGQIYAQAERVLIWLGEMTEDVKMSLGSINHLHEFIAQHDDGYAQGDIPYDKERDGAILTGELLDMSESGFDWIPVITLIRRPWFQRLWVVQEVIKAPHHSAIIVCGDQIMHWAVIEKVFAALNMHGLLSYFAQKAGTFNLQNIVTIGRMRQHHNDPIRSSMILDLITDTRNFQCMDARDRIFALLGLATSVNQEITPNYKLSVEDVFKAFTIGHILRSRKLHALSYSYSTPSRLPLPSWVPDYTTLHVAEPLVKLGMAMPLPFDATKGLESNPRFSDDDKILHLDGVAIDKVKSIGSIQVEIKVPDSLPNLNQRILKEQDTDLLIKTAL
jgi:hypothetical protein